MSCCSRKWRRLLLTSPAALFFLIFFLSPLEPPGLSPLELDIAVTSQMQLLGRDAALPDQDTVVYDPCAKTACQGSPFLLAMYITAPPNHAKRDALRDVWKFQDKDSSLLDKEVKRYFFVGMPERAEDLDALTTEAETFQDIVLDNFQDSYLNLTLKVLRMLKWVNGNFPSANFLMKIDDDVHVNLASLLSLLSGLNRTRTENFVGGVPHKENAPIRNPGSKWYVPKALWNEKFYPDFAGGPAYVLGSRARESLYNGALEMRIFPLEDVFLTGIVRRTIFPVPVEEVSGTSDWNYLYRLNFPCSIKRKYTLIHPLSWKELRCLGQFERWCDDWFFVPMILLC